MAVKAVVLLLLIDGVIEHNERGVLLTVNNAGLERGIELTEGKALGNSAEGFHRGKVRRALHAADIQTLDIVRCLYLTHIIGEVAEAAVIESGDDAHTALVGDILVHCRDIVTVEEGVELAASEKV